MPAAAEDITDGDDDRDDRESAQHPLHGDSFADRRPSGIQGGADPEDPWCMQPTLRGGASRVNVMFVAPAGRLRSMSGIRLRGLPDVGAATLSDHF
ncbi:hypothetical protein GCM10022206_59410 [Streptomyces chiangmaiensis]